MILSKLIRSDNVGKNEKVTELQKIISNIKNDA